MNARLLPIFGLVVCLSLLFTPLGTAQQPEPAPVSPSPDPSVVSPAVDASPSAASDLVYPGLSFRHVDTLGVTEEAYPADTQHLNGPDGMAVDGSGYLYVVENSGARLLKYRVSDGSHVWTIGKAGFQVESNYTFNSPGDVELDGTGNVWISDLHSVTQYDADGNFLQELPPDDPWNNGDDNTHFDEPRGITFDSAGRMYVSDHNNHRVQVYTFTVSGDPVYSTTIGVTGVSGSDDAHFNKPAQLVTDSSDRLYVADTSNHRVQRCEYNGGWTCTTFDDQGLSFPFGLGIDDSNDTLYISDNNNGRVKICDTTTDTCEEFTAEPDRPTDVVIDSSGGIYISDWNDCVIEEYDASGTSVRTVVGVEGVPYTTDDSHFNEPYGIDVDAEGNVYVGTESGYRLLKLGTPTWSVGTPGVHGGTNQMFGSWWAGVRGVAVAPDGTTYAVDTANERVQVFSSDGTYLSTLGSAGSGDYQFIAPEGAAVDDLGNLYVADSGNHRVQIYDSDLVYQATLGETGVSGSDNAHFDNPDNVAVDGDGNVYVADENNDRVQVFDSSGTYSQTIGSGKLSSPQDVAVDAQGRVYVADIYSQRVQVFAADGDYLTTIGGDWGSDPGRFRHAAGVAVGDDSRVYIADALNHRIQVLVPHIPGWRQANVNGFGNSSNWGAWSVGVFSDTLYVSTSNFGDGAEVYRLSGDAWERVATGGFGDSANVAVNKFAPFDGQLYAGTWASSGGGQIWRSPSGDDGSWTPVVSDGFSDTVNVEIIALKPFDGELYAGTYCEHDAAHGGEIWRSADADSWTQVVSDTVFGESNNSAIPSLEVFSNTLYAATLNDDTGAEVWCTGNGTDWIQVNIDGFDSVSNTHVATLEVFDDQLYAGVSNYEEGGEIWRTSDGTNWEQVASGGLGDGDNNTFSSLVVLRGDLYAIADNNETGAEVWRSSTGDSGSWQLVADTGFGSGAVSQADWEGAATVWNNTLFVGTYTYGNGGGRVWEMLRQIFLPLTLRD